MTASSGGLHQEIDFCVQEMEKLRVAELKAVSRAIGLSLSGRKADLQDRIRAYLKNSFRLGSIDPWRPKAILVLIDKAKLSDPLPTYESVWQSLRTGAFRHPVATGHQPPSALNPSAIEVHKPPPVPRAPKTRLALQFGESPFYKLRRMLNGSPKLAAKNNGRGVCIYRFLLNQEESSILGKGPQFKLYLFSGILDPLENRGDAPIQFPHPNEIRFNDVQVKDNVRGLKNKPGTAKPADLTPYLRPSGSENVLQLIYAFTKSDYLMYCYLVEVISPEKILQEVLRHPKIVKPATLQYLKETLSEDEDEDLVTTSTVMTLQCPISYCRMRYPSKSVYCQHLQCFDSLWFIESQQQIPTWHCPVCQKKIKIEDLALCEFVEEIIQQCDEEVEQVEISRDGTWKPVFEDDPPAPQQHSATEVKLENGHSLEGIVRPGSEDSDEEPISSRRRNLPQNEPVVISLDSDDEEEEAPKAAPQPPGENQTPSQPGQELQERPGGRTAPSNSTLPHENTLANIYGTYMDINSGHEPQRSLDPKNANTTPSSARFNFNHGTPNNSETPNSSPFIQPHHQIPNLLGKTPLNNNVNESYTSGHEQGQKSPSPTVSVQQSSSRVHPSFGEVNVPLLNAHNQGPNIQSGHTPVRRHSENTSAYGQEVRLTYRPSSFANNTLPPPWQDVRGQQSLLGLGGDTSQIHREARRSSTGSYNGENSLEGVQDHSRSPPLVARQPVINGAPIHNSPHSERGATSSAPPFSKPPAPAALASTGPLISSPRSQGQPPPLPPVPQSINRAESGQKPASASNARYRKPIVSPFIPKKPYVNMLPQKRQISSTSINKVAPTGHNAHSSQTRQPQLENEGVSVSATSPPPLLAQSMANELDFIDLTSDE
ncbi:SUMO ligase SIZ1 [Lachancea thermotolerans CBS 6340]|uniref:KLTH0G03212p n=1 Tax=Lachancea thermotolerans (strain ATCC 56472 / CBS 6340 / NRRL Y-8284) TaxID=559295 RepID=C5DLT1_LACTC|nr:KLTH0G03212p [Lachancea thermotolerans CBS 6340]CAR24742.1 KLTH0G03212p [Lachancea thermotolerans CBS 6340]